MIPRTQAAAVRASPATCPLSAEIDGALEWLQRPQAASGDTKLRLMQARVILRELALALGEKAQADRLEAQLYDVWLRLECARALGDGALLEAQRQAWARLVAQVTATAPASQAA